MDANPSFLRIASKKVSDRLPKLQNSWIQAETAKPPKLKGNASCTRALIPFAHALALELLDATQPMEEAMITAAYHLHRYYTCLSKDTHGWRDILSQSSSEVQKPESSAETCWSLNSRAGKTFCAGVKEWLPRHDF